MFNGKLEKKITNLESRIDKYEDTIKELLNIINRRMDELEKNSKKSFAWKLRSEEVELIEGGKKLKEVIRILK